MPLSMPGGNGTSTCRAGGIARSRTSEVAIMGTEGMKYI